MLTVTCTRSIYVSQRKIARTRNQLCQWITIIERVRKNRPTTISISWKTNQGRIINLAFGASITALNWDDRKELCLIRQENDEHLLPRDQYRNVDAKLEDWEFGNCSEM